MSIFSRMVLPFLVVSGSAVANEETTATLAPFTTKAPAGSTLKVALTVTPPEGWHTYYLDPGEMGLPVSLEWKDLPDGITAGSLAFPLPHRVSTGDLATQGYEDPTHFVAELKLSEEVATGPVTLAATASWLACDNDACVPGSQDLTLDFEVIPAGETAPKVSSEMSQILLNVPIDAGSKWQSELTSNESDWQLILTPPADWTWPPANSLDLFSETPDFLAPGHQPIIENKDKKLVITAPKSEYADEKASPALVLFGPQPPLRFTPEISAKSGE
ncbi:MAG: protein-disulfide reductase DsbD family protein [Verrucomicrobiota bacterium JB023]|nr:protein-disulfide reductase DsbD family protein [Verrucomicrobiota bacterium JB023]